MFCPNCGNQMKDGSEFCSNCGWSKESNVSKKGVLKIPKIPKVVLKSVFAVLGIVILALIIYNVPKPKGKVYEFSDIRKVKPVTKYWKNSVVDNFDTVIFGSYPQSDASGNAKEPIEWIVLERDENKALLLSKYILDCKSYENSGNKKTWGTSTLRAWLNNQFYGNAFSSDEQNKIVTTNVINNEEYGITGGNNTNDKIFCLSIDEVIKYFNQSNMDSENKRVATKGTNYAKKVDNGGFNLYVVGSGRYDENSYFWLRSPRGLRVVLRKCMIVGYLVDGGVGIHDIGVRPALWVSY